MTPYRAIGIMSGTSGDGVDAVLLHLDDVYSPRGARIISRASIPFPQALQQELVMGRTLPIARLTELHFSLPTLYAEAALALEEGHTASVIGVHGQTITHQVAARRPNPRGTLQIGATAVVAAATGLPVVGDLRAMDVALGGQGAPISPFAHWYFLGGQSVPTLVVNLGGICNVSWVGTALHDVLGYDVGPGMMLSNAFACRTTGDALGYDKDGTLSEGGHIIQSLLDTLLTHPFVARSAPKSAGREEFGHSYYTPLFEQYRNMPTRDVMATLHAATAAILARSVQAQGNSRAPLARVVLCGGGALNPTLRTAIARALHPVPVVVEAEGPLAPLNHEPAAMALFAARTMHELPSALSEVTGADYGAVLGHIVRPTPVASRLLPASPPRAADAVNRLQNALHQVAQDILQANDAAAVSYAVCRTGEMLLDEAWGHPVRYWRDKTSASSIAIDAPEALTSTHRFDVASLTKVAATTAVVMALISDGRLALHARAETLIPELAGTAAGAATVAELLAHRSGLPPWAPLYLTASTPREAMQWLAQEPIGAAPPHQRLYSDLGYMLLGQMIAAVVGDDWDAYFQARIALPLQLTHTGFRPKPAERARCVATAHGQDFERVMLTQPDVGPTFRGKGTFSHEPWPGYRTTTQQGEVNDGNAHHVFAGLAGHAGLFSTAGDLSRLAAAMAQPAGSTAAHSGLFLPQVVRDFSRPYNGNDYYGWVSPTRWQSLAPWHEPLARHGALLAEGFTGCLLLVIPTRGIACSLLTNRLHQRDTQTIKPPVLYAHYAAAVGAIVEHLV